MSFSVNFKNVITCKRMEENLAEFAIGKLELPTITFVHENSSVETL